MNYLNVNQLDVHYFSLLKTACIILSCHVLLDHSLDRLSPSLIYFRCVRLFFISYSSNGETFVSNSEHLATLRCYTFIEPNKH